MVGFILDFGTLKGIATSIGDARAYRQRPAGRVRNWRVLPAKIARLTAGTEARSKRASLR